MLPGKGYYFGNDDLFSRHPDIVQACTRFLPVRVLELQCCDSGIPTVEILFADQLMTGSHQRGPDFARGLAGQTGLAIASGGWRAKTRELFHQALAGRCRRTVCRCDPMDLPDARSRDCSALCSRHLVATCQDPWIFVWYFALALCVCVLLKSGDIDGSGVDQCDIWSIPAEQSLAFVYTADVPHEPVDLKDLARRG